jgi:hypothetical protein
VVARCRDCGITEALLADGPGVVAVRWDNSGEWGCDACPAARLPCVHVLAAVRVAETEEAWT